MLKYHDAQNQGYVKIQTSHRVERQWDLFKSLIDPQKQWKYISRNKQQHLRRIRSKSDVSSCSKPGLRQKQNRRVLELSDDVTYRRSYTSSKTMSNTLTKMNNNSSEV